MESLPLSEEKQLAFIGHCFIDRKIFDKSIDFIDQDWFMNPLSSTIYATIKDFYRSYHRQPSIEEIKNSKYLDTLESELKGKIPDEIDRAIALADKIGSDIIKNEIDAWNSQVTLKKTLKLAVHDFNEQSYDKAWSVLDKNCIKIRSSSFSSGQAPTFAPAYERAALEKIERLEQSKHILNYGVKYLDDSLGGIIPNDLIIIGAKSGMGKTSLANFIARTTAMKGYPVHYFALEAENSEQERRIKFSILSDLFYKYVPNEHWPPNGTINYLDWRLGKIESLLAPYENEALDIFKNDLKNFYSLYRTSGDFSLETLDRHISAIAKESKLIIIDHLHYIDIPNQNENAEYKNITKSVRDACLKYGVPVIVIAHLRKELTGARSKALISNLEDFHGSSDIFKISTVSIMIAPAFDEIKTHPHLWPTYIRPVKTRLEQVRTRYTGLVDFNARNNVYESKYRIGKMINGDSEWIESEGSEIPSWAKKEIV